MIDSTEAPAIEAGLQMLGGKPLVTSINYEDGGGRVDKVLQLCRKYGAGVVALTIDEEGMSKSVEGKLAITDRLLSATGEHGLPDHDVFIDALTFTFRLRRRRVPAGRRGNNRSDPGDTQAPSEGEYGAGCLQHQLRAKADDSASS